MFVVGIDKIAQVECLVAFAHSRITGIAGNGQDGVEVFRNRFVQKEAVNHGKQLSDVLKDLAAIEIINSKITSCNNHVAQLYYNYYSKLTYLLDKYIKSDEVFIEGLIGLHLLILATEKGLLNNGQDNLDYYYETVKLYENPNYTKDEQTMKTVLRMREITGLIFEDYLRKKKKVSKKRKQK